MNPDLGTPGQSGPSVPALVAITAPLPNDKAPEMKYYICTMQAAGLHRTDGKKLPFAFGYLATDLLYDQQYLDNEIRGGNPYLRYAEVTEVRDAEMRLDPRGTMRKEVTAELMADPAFMAELEATMRGDLEAKIRAEMEAGTTGAIAGAKPQQPATTAAPVNTVLTDAAKVAGTSASERARELLKKAADAKAGQHLAGTAGATVTVTGDNAGTSVVQPFKPVSTADISSAAVDSNKK